MTLHDSLRSLRQSVAARNTKPMSSSSHASKKKAEHGELAAQLRAAAELLEKAAANREVLGQLSQEERTRLLKAAGDIYCPDVRERRRLVKATSRQRKSDRTDRVQSVLNETGIRSLRRKPVFTTPNLPPPPKIEPQEVESDPEFREVVEPQNCYICKKDYSTIHHFYDQLCSKCAELNFRKRTELADLSGRVALLTGGRVKIGYQAGIKLLRAGAQLIVTTRFPRDSAMRYAQEPDFAEWGHRLEIFGLDLRHTPSVEAFCQHIMKKYARLDFIINNACQTVRRPPDFYAHMMADENKALNSMPENVRHLVGAYEGLRGYHMLPEGGMARAEMKSAGPVVWLQASADTIERRLATDPTTGQRRPNLTSTGGRAEIDRLLALREPLYRECATIVLDSENISIAEMVDVVAGGNP